ncbi:elongator complex protein 3 [Orenia marismortui]|uniref:elongator complex protein 3 n=1 Tax=Orenia marismortui TaxID=46469 RepID=UPI00036139E2|nr:radical SAM protein [Orenia marismortui]
MAKDNYIIPIFVPHLGCPHDCVFCNQREITGVRTRLSQDEVIHKIDSYLSTIPKTAKKIEVAFYGGSFTGVDPKYQIELLSVAKERLVQGRINGIRLSTRPDYINNQILLRLKKYGVTAIELGAQSLKDEVLKASTRGHSRSDVIKAVNLIRKYDFKLGLQIMPGLPASNLESDIATAKEIINLNPDFVRIYPTLVIKGTELAELYKAKKYTPLSLEDAVEISSLLLQYFKEAGIKVIRIGLQPSEGVNNEQVVAGPFHSSFRQLVESRLLLKKIEEKIKVDKINRLVLVVNSKDMSNIRGQKNSNINYLYDKYNLEEIDININDNLARGSLTINIE